MSFLSRLFGGPASLSPATFVAEGYPAAPVLDVRTPREFASGRLTGSINVDLNAPDFPRQVEALVADGTIATSQPVYLYCRSGSRSGRAARILREMGFPEAWNVGGFHALRAAGADVET